MPGFLLAWVVTRAGKLGVSGCLCDGYSVTVSLWGLTLVSYSITLGDSSLSGTGSGTVRRMPGASRAQLYKDMSTQYREH